MKISTEVHPKRSGYHGASPRPVRAARQSVRRRRAGEPTVASPLLIAQNSDRHVSQNPILLKSRIDASRINALGFAETLCV